MKVKEEGEKADLKWNIHKSKIMVSSPITSWQIDGGRGMEKVIDFIFLSSKITADSDCSHEIKTLAPWKNYVQSRQDIKKQRHHFAYKDPYSESYSFSSSHVQM